MIHKTGYPTIIIVLTFIIIVLIASHYCLPPYLTYGLLFLGVGFFLFILSFFRNPNRPIPINDSNRIYAPADGKVVVIEEIDETEYFNDRRLQISIFMSPLNVHVNRTPVDSTVKKIIYHEGKYLPAWNPKSSTENERCYTVFDTEGGVIMLKQIAGALARRIVNFTQEGASLSQGEEYGFIKFGSRVDLILPLTANVVATMDQKVKGNVDVIATFE